MPDPLESTQGLSPLTNILGGISPVGAALSIGSTLFGAIKGAGANNANQQLIRQQEAENQKFYGLNYSQDFLKSNMAQDVMRQAREGLVDANKMAAGRAAITGASDEAQVAMNSEAQKNYNALLGNVASMGVNYQLGQQRMYMANREAIQARRMAFNQMRAENAANAVENAGDLFGTLAFTNALKGEKISDGGMGETVQETRPVFGRNTVPWWAFFSAPYKNNATDNRNESPGSWGQPTEYDNRNEDLPTK